jgi:hypothetical protein
MGFLWWWAEDDGHETMLSDAEGAAYSVGVGVSGEIRFDNRTEYTVINNPSQTAEYRHKTYSDTE